MKHTLNAGESPVSFPETVSELQAAGLCQHCLEAPPLPRPNWPTLTDEELDEALVDLDRSLGLN